MISFCGHINQSFNKIECPKNKIVSNCSNACNQTCSTLSCAKKCLEPDTCKVGCVCPNGLVENDKGDCVPAQACQCSYMGVSYSDGDYIEDKYNCKK